MSARKSKRARSNTPTPDKSEASENNCPVWSAQKTHLEDFVQSLERNRKNPRLCDVTFVVSNKKFPCSRMIVASWSEPLGALVGGRLREAGEEEVTLHDVDQLAFSMVLEWMMSGGCSTFSAMHTNRILHVAAQWQVKALVSICQDILSSDIDKDNVWERINVGQNYALTSLITSCCDYLATHITDLNDPTLWSSLDADTMAMVLSSQNVPSDELAVWNKAVAYLGLTDRPPANDAEAEKADLVLSSVRYLSLPPAFLAKLVAIKPPAFLAVGGASVRPAMQLLLDTCIAARSVFALFPATGQTVDEELFDIVNTGLKHMRRWDLSSLEDKDQVLVLADLDVARHLCQWGEVVQPGDDDNDDIENGKKQYHTTRRVPVLWKDSMSELIGKTAEVIAVKGGVSDSVRLQLPGSESKFYFPRSILRKVAPGSEKI